MRCHHERFDGAGYPDGLRQDEIPFLARILSVADAYDAMASDRAYRKRMERGPDPEHHPERGRAPSSTRRSWMSSGRCAGTPRSRAPRRPVD
ncbi:MAG: hypothetical protein MZV70_50580 [Desulfobacterales bacterium]|nr:hypothetical protein [Desulfobacterales bacterium]